MINLHMKHSLLSIFMLFGPIHHPIVNESFALKEIFQQASQPGVIGFFLVFQSADVFEVFAELFWVRRDVQGRP